MLDPLSDRGWVQCKLTSSAKLELKNHIKSKCYLSALGTSLPFCVSDAAMVTNPEGNGVVLSGGYNWSKWNTSNVMLELKVVDNHLKWVKLPLELTDARSRHLCIPVPEDYVIPKST